MQSLATRVAARALVGQKTRVEGDGYAQRGITLPIATGRVLNEGDNGMTLQCTATLTLQIPEGLPDGFRCKVITNGTTSFDPTGATQVNGATSTVTRAAATAANAVVEIVQRADVANSYTVTGA